jgi:charged multivesicular body protein 6
MKNQRDKLQQYQKRITVITDRETEIARECLKKGDRKKALLALRRKKYQESLLQKTDRQLAQLEILTNDVEFAEIQKDVLFGLRQGTQVLKQIHNEMGGMQNIEKLLGDTAEAQAYVEVYDFPLYHFRTYNPDMMGPYVMKEISDLLRGRISNQDEDEVEDELEALEREVSGVQLPDAPEAALPEGEQKETAKERRGRRAKEQAEAEEAQRAEPILA